MDAVSILHTIFYEDQLFFKVLQQITKHDIYIDDNTNQTVVLNQLLIITQQYLIENNWKTSHRKYDATNKVTDTTWCSPFPTHTLNQLYISDEKLHVTKCTNGLLLSESDILELEIDKISICHYDEDNRECRILINLQPLRNVLRNYTRPKYF